MQGRSLHIGVDATCWSNDRGFGRMTRQLLTALAARDAGFRYTLLFDQTPELPVPDGVEVRIGGASENISEAAVGRSSRSLGYLWTLGRLAAREQFDVFFFPAVYSYFPLLSRLPVVVCYPDAIAERFPDLIFPTKRNALFWNLKTRLATWQTTRAMTISQASADDLVEHIGLRPERIDIVPLAADARFTQLADADRVAHARSRLGVSSEAPLLGYVGGFNRHKNLIRLLQAMPRVLEQRPDAELAIVGSVSGKGFWDNLPELRSFASEHPELEKRLHFTGYLDDDELVAFLNTIDALVFPSLCEGFGLPALEAMSCGTPVLVSETGSLPEVVGDTGLYYDPHDPEAIASTILRFLEGGEGLRDDLSARGLARAATFSWDRAAEHAEACFRRAISVR